MVVAHLHGLALRLDRTEGQVARVDNPWRQRHHLARGQGPVPDQPPDHCGTDPSLLCGLLEGQPLMALGDMGKTMRISAYWPRCGRAMSCPSRCDIPSD
jgi:hypothetical protein